jgi:hypothetical protein
MVVQDRIENWDRFARHMRKYISEQTIAKYSADKSTHFDLMSFTKNPMIAVWNILKYTFRIWNSRMKERDLEKIVHYAEIAWTMTNEGQDIIRDQNGKNKPRDCLPKVVSGC